jgi:hypothetical protein
LTLPRPVRSKDSRYLFLFNFSLSFLLLYQVLLTCSLKILLKTKSITYNLCSPSLLCFCTYCLPQGKNFSPGPDLSAELPLILLELLRNSSWISSTISEISTSVPRALFPHLCYHLPLCIIIFCGYPFPKIDPSKVCLSWESSY